MDKILKQHTVTDLDFAEYLDSLLLRGESVDVEFKMASNGFPNSLWETYSSFANTDGGTIVLGVREKGMQLFVEGLSHEQVVSYKQILWNQLNNRDSVSINLLVDKNILDVEYLGKNLLLIFVPRAPRPLRPVFLTRNPMNGHTYKRNNEGDYKCTDMEVRRMIADADEEHPRDSRILSNYSLNDIDPESLRQYRIFLSSRQPGHPWLTQDDLGFLTKLGGYRVDRQSGDKGFTVAGILMFGKTESITDLECVPSYFPDYQEKFSSDSDIRWTDRICPDGTWEANLFQFYKRVYPKLATVLPKPFQLENGVRQDETATHIALREAFVNALIHCDYMEDGNITIEQWKDHYIFKNPGALLVSKAQYYAGGESLCRNKSLQKMFMMIGFSEKAGSGVNKIFAGWEKANWKTPFMEELNRPDRIVLHLPMESLFPDSIVIELKKLLEDKFEQMTHEQLSALAICCSEGQISNERLQYVFNKHSSDITKILKVLCDGGYLTSFGAGRGTKYHIRISSGKVESNSRKVESNSGKVESNSGKVESNLGKVESNSRKVESNSGKVESVIVQTRYMRYADICELIRSASVDYISLDEIAGIIQREPSYLINKIIPRMIDEEKLERLYPATPKHPQQKYRTTQRSEEHC